MSIPSKISKTKIFFILGFAATVRNETHNQILGRFMPNPSVNFLNCGRYFQTMVYSADDDTPKTSISLVFIWPTISIVTVSESLLVSRFWLHLWNGLAYLNSFYNKWVLGLTLQTWKKPADLLKGHSVIANVAIILGPKKRYLLKKTITPWLNFKIFEIFEQINFKKALIIFSFL